MPAVLDRRQQDLFDANQELIAARWTPQKTQPQPDQEGGELMKHSAINHAKVIRLSRLIRQILPGELPVAPNTVAIGILERLWHLTIESAPQGDIGRVDDDTIAECVGWTAEADTLIAALVECGWLDPCDKHRLVIHDWEDHCPVFIKGNMGRSGKPFLVAVGDGTKYRSKEPTKYRTEGRTTKPNQTKPNQTTPNQRTSAPSNKFDDACAFDAFWDSVHIKVGKSGARSAFTKAVDAASREKGVSRETAAGLITESMRAFAQTPAATPKDHSPIHPATWLNNGRYDDDRATWELNGKAKVSSGVRYDPTDTKFGEGFN